MLLLAKSKLVAFLHASEFPSEIPRAQNRNFSYTNTIGSIAQENKNAELRLEKILNFFIFSSKKWKLWNTLSLVWIFSKLRNLARFVKILNLTEFAEFLLERKLKRNSKIAELKIFAEFKCWNLLKYKTKTQNFLAFFLEKVF